MSKMEKKIVVSALTPRQQVLRKYPNAFCFAIQERRAYQIALRLGSGNFEGFSDIVSTRKRAWAIAAKQIEDEQ